MGPDRRVFVVQRPAYRLQGKWVDKFDLRPAEEFGPLLFMLPPGNVFYTDLERAQTSVRELLTEHSFCEMDAILPVGDPLAIAICSVIASRISPSGYHILKWDNREGIYQLLAVRFL